MNNRFLSKNKKRSFGFNGIVMTLFVFFLVFATFCYGLNSVSESSNQEELKNLEQALRRSAVHCYALEGVYPPDVAYIEENYGLMIDHEKYIVHYNIFASNIMADITVMIR